MEVNVDVQRYLYPPPAESVHANPFTTRHLGDSARVSHLVLALETIVQLLDQDELEPAGLAARAVARYAIAVSGRGGGS